ncbi:hypothetical protein [Nostoc sp.]|uniref:hypothetical protein n=1 Tax=Nostoc sp. TaxID=1180 RepID=UPI002FF98142
MPSSINGLSDYTLNLARHLRKNYGIKTSCIVGDRIWTGTAEIEEFVLAKLVWGSRS